jgi:hypothetical protein
MSYARIFRPSAQLKEDPQADCQPSDGAFTASGELLNASKLLKAVFGRKCVLVLLKSGSSLKFSKC